MRIVIFTTINLYSNIILSKLINERYNEIFCIVETTGIFPKKNLCKTIKKIYLNFSLSFFLFKVFETILYRMTIFVGIIYHALNKKKKDLKALASRYSIPIIKRKNVNSFSFISWIKSISPDLIISVSANQKICSSLLSVSKYGGINVHASQLPYYKGVCPYFWVIKNGEVETGVTVHRMDEHFDTGAIISQESVPIHATDTLHSLFLRCAFVGEELLYRTIFLTENGKKRTSQNMDVGTYYSWPKVKDVVEFKKLKRRFWYIGIFIKDVFKHLA